jgi:hypothetical protein
LSAKRWHDLILGGFLILAVVELVLLPVCKIVFGHAILPWLQR